MTALAAAGAAGLVGCGGGEARSDASINAVVYRFNDASVPPEYHRSYTLTVVEGSATIVVDSYGDVLHDVTQTIETTLWDATVEAARQFVGADDVVDEVGCAGGTSDSLSAVDSGGNEVVDIAVDHCGGRDPDLSLVVAGVLATFDLDALLAPSDS
jgi:hypothetical protein